MAVMALALSSWRFVAPFAVLLAAAGPFVLPEARHAYESWRFADDPARLSDLSLRRVLDAHSLNARLEAALEDDDVDLADSLLHLASQQGFAVREDLNDRYAAAMGVAASLARDAKAFWHGAVSGKGEGGAGLTGTLVTDLSGIGDVRDLIVEGQKAAKGEPVDELVVALSAAGLVLSGAVIASFGSAMPARGGASVVKAAAKSGQLSRPLASSLGRLASEAVDVRAMAAAGRSLGVLDLTAARTSAGAAIRPQVFARLGTVLGDVSAIGSKAGLRAMQDGLRIARSGEEIGRLSVLAARRGGATRAILSVLGRGAIAVTLTMAAMVGWISAGIGYGIMVVLLLIAVLRLLWRMLRQGFRLLRWAARS